MKSDFQIQTHNGTTSSFVPYHKPGWLLHIQLDWRQCFFFFNRQTTGLQKWDEKWSVTLINAGNFLSLWCLVFLHGWPLVRRPCALGSSPEFSGGCEKHCQRIHACHTAWPSFLSRGTMSGNRKLMMNTDVVGTEGGRDREKERVRKKVVGKEIMTIYCLCGQTCQFVLRSRSLCWPFA